MKHTAELVVELDDAGVVLEDAQAPRLGQLARGLEDRGLDEVVGISSTGRPGGRVTPTSRAERFVDAVLAPGLGDHLQLDVGAALARRRGSTPGSPSFR